MACGQATKFRHRQQRKEAKTLGILKLKNLCIGILEENSMQDYFLILYIRRALATVKKSLFRIFQPSQVGIT